jgi:pimeloyl-ACP methyl ester carboxylesterase
MRVWDSGSGSPLLAIHGLGGSGRYWEGLAGRLGERYRIVAPDLAGFGASDKPRDASYDRAMHLESLDAAAEELGGGPIVVVGHSLGALFAGLWAARHRSRIRALGLAAPPFPSGEPGPAWMRERRPPGGPAGWLFRVGVPLLSLPVGLARRYPSAVAIDYGRQNLRARGATTWSALHDPAVLGELESLRALPADTPQLLVHAPDDRTVPIGAHERWASLLPNARREHVARGLGHQFLLRTRFEPLASWLETLDGKR